jgi:FixJ family two-component response regulator
MAEACGWIAIIDDDPAVLRALARLLRTRSFLTKTYESSHSFLSNLQEGLPSCMVLDLQMPIMNGLELQRHLAHRGIRIPTIFISAHGDAKVRMQCETAGSIAFLAKPLQETSLFAAIDEAIGNNPQ